MKVAANMSQISQGNNLWLSGQSEPHWYVNLYNP